MIGKHNLAVVTVAVGEDNDRLLSTLRRSAQINEIDLHVCSDGSDVEYNNAYHKVDILRSWINKLHPRYKYVLAIDGYDSFFVSSVTEICEKYEVVNPSIIVGAERENWPERDTAWARPFKPQQSGRNYINSGLVMGPRKLLIDALGIISGLRDQFASENLEGLEDIYWLKDHALKSEQILWQIASYKHLVPVNLDSNCSFIANMTTDDLVINGNKFYSLSKGRLVCRESGTSPSILHFPGPGVTAMDNWFNEIYMDNT